MIAAIVQARMGSSRLPGKVLLPLQGKPMLIQQLERVQRVKGLDQVIVATTTEPGDQVIVDVCREYGIACYRGSSSDVLDRYYQIAKEVGANEIIRVTADCPLLDPQVVDQLVEYFHDGEFDYAANNLRPTLPDGLDAEVFRFEVLEEAWKEAKLPSEREHVTPFIRKNSNRYHIGSLTADQDFSFLRWTVDEPEDYDAVRKIYDYLFPKHHDFGMTEVLELYDQMPELKIINQDLTRDAGLQKSYRQDELSERYKRTNELFKAASGVIPLGSQTFSKSKTQFPVGASPLFIERGSGSRVWDVDGNEYIDVMSSLGAINLGYNDADVLKRVKEQLEHGTIFSLAHPLEVSVAKKLIEVVPCAEMVRFGKNGSDVTTGAIRLARAYTGREHVVTCGYHGWHDWYIGTTPRNLGVPESTRQLTHALQYNDVDALKAVFFDYPNEVACVIMEPMTREEPRDGYLESVKGLCEENGALLIFDEMIMGFRHAVAGGQELFGVTPDLATYGKGIANGYPLSALVGRAEVMSLLEEIFFSFTFGGETLSLAAAEVTIEKVKEHDVPGHIRKHGEAIIAGVRELAQECEVDDIVAISGPAAWSFLDFKEVNGVSSWELLTLFLQETLARGILTRGVHTLSYAHNQDDVQHILNVYREVFPILKRAAHQKQIKSLLLSKPLQPLFKIR